MPERPDRDDQARKAAGGRARLAALVADLEDQLGSAGPRDDPERGDDLRQSIVRLGREAVRLFNASRQHVRSAGDDRAKDGG